ncbi:hypothetical protein D6779_01340, partial [Candidatus Parcubacteria bacterium]
MPINASLLASYFRPAPAHFEVPYFILGSRRPQGYVAGTDSSHQDVLIFDEVSGVTAYRAGWVVTDPANRVVYKVRSEISLSYVMPTLRFPSELPYRIELARALYRRMRVARRTTYAHRYVKPVLVHPRQIAAQESEIADYQATRQFLNSIYALPGTLFLRDGRLFAENYPGPSAVDSLYRLMVARGVRAVGVVKSGKLVEVLRPYARALRARQGSAPFAFAVSREHLLQAYGGGGSNPPAALTLRHGASGNACGGVGALRFAFCPAMDVLFVLEFNLYDLRQLRPLVSSGMSLQAWWRNRNKGETSPVFSWDIFPLVEPQDWHDLFLPVLENLVYCGQTETELGLYPRALAEAHNYVKLRR